MNIEIRRNWEFSSEILPGVVIKLRYLTVAELDECWIIKKTDGKPTFDVDMRKMVGYAVTKIEGLNVVDEKKKSTKIESIEALLNTPGLTDLYYEIYKEVVTNNARVDSKNLPSPSDT